MKEAYAYSRCGGLGGSPTRAAKVRHAEEPETSTARRPGTERWESPKTQNQFCAVGGSHLLFMGCLRQRTKRRPGMGATRSRSSHAPAGARCVLHPRVLLHEITSAGRRITGCALQGRGPKEMRIGLNLIRITAEAERDWQLRMQEPNADFERRATASREGRRCRSQKLQAHQHRSGAARRGAARRSTT